MFSFLKNKRAVSSIFPYPSIKTPKIIRIEYNPLKFPSS